jgi:poly-gamma-glutamate synthesis protein (capsule biosynthesis protein)
MKINIFGDFVVSGRLKEVLSMGSTNTVLREDILNYLYSSDYNIVNLESPITRNGIPIDKLGPNLKSSPEILHLIKLGRINICTLANNHIMDFGQEGLSQTLRLLKENDISYVGVGDNIENAAKPLILEGEKGNIGIINIAEHEFNLAAPNKSGANPLNPIQNYYQIKELQDKVDKIILIVHGGHEHYEYPSPRMQDTYRFFIDSGVDVVVGHHPHCYSGYENYMEG